MRAKGFTLMELLVVIAIIGFLSTVVIVNVNRARTKARFASAVKTMRAIHPVLVLCQTNGGIIVGLNKITLNPNEPCTGEASDFPKDGLPFCSDQNASPGTWPVLPNPWGYAGACSGDSNAGTYFYRADSLNCRIECTQLGCVSIGPACPN